jgi:hypothetical protein
VTAYRRVILRCDCCPTLLGMASEDEAQTVKEARAQARKAGWRLDKLHRDVCPAHPKLKGSRQPGRV